MTDPHLWTLTSHAILLGTSIALKPQYGQSSKSTKKSSVEESDSIGNLKRKTAVELARKLEPVFNQPGASIEVQVVDQNGRPYALEEVRPAGSERYRAAFFGYVEENINMLCEYKKIRDYHNTWNQCRKVISLLFSITWIVEAIVLAAFLLAVFDVYKIGPVWCLISFVPIFTLFFTFLCYSRACDNCESMIASITHNHETL